MTAVISAVPGTARLRFTGVLSSEWIKTTSLRSTLLALALVTIVGLGSSVALAATMESAGLPSEASASFTLWTVTFGTVMFGQLVAAVLGVLASSGEYSTGMIQTTFAAVPTRLPVLAAKSLVLFVVVTATALVTVVGSWAVTYPMFDRLGLAVGLGEPGLAAALFGAAAYLGLVAVFALGLGMTLRSAAGGITATLGVLLLLPLVVSMFAGSFDWLAASTPYLLSVAGEGMSLVADEGGRTHPAAPLHPGAASLVVAAWTAVSLALAALLVKTRDS